MVEKYQELIDFLPECIILRKYNKIVFANKETEKLLKISKEDLFNKDILEIIHDESKSLVRNRLSKDIEELKISSVEEKLLDSEGKSIDVEVSIIPVTIKNETYALTIIRDITKRKKVAEKEKQIQVIKENEKFKSSFITNISHEFNTPVNVIYTAVQLLEGKTIDPNYKKYLNIIRKNCERIIRLNNNIIDVTRYETGNLSPKFKKEDLSNILSFIIKECNEFLNDKGIKINYKSQGKMELFCDRNMIERMILNIISNSVKFSRENGEIDLKVEKKEAYIIISINDNGIGIGKEQLKTIFEMFNKENMGLDRRAEGIGIGLTLAKAFAYLHNGKIEIISKKDEGTKVTIFLPYNGVNKEVAGGKCVIDDKKNVNIELSDIY